MCKIIIILLIFCITNLACHKLKNSVKSKKFIETDDNFPTDWDIQFILFTRSTRQNPTLTILPFNATNDMIKSTAFDANKRTNFLVHGWLVGFNISDTSGSFWMKNVTDVMLNELDANVFCVDWSKVAGDVLYFPVVPDTQVVGKMIGYFINRLVLATRLSLNNIHLIGHSMGAHIVGFAGKSLAPDKVAQISGLDPAGPGYGDGQPRLSKHDAQLVICTHTSSGIIYEGSISITGFIGNVDSLGHYDFRLNGGNYQPVCNQLYPSTDDLEKDILHLVMCSHEMAYKYPIMVPTDNCQFIGYKCHHLDQFNDGQCARIALPMEFNFAYYDNTSLKLNQTSTPNEIFIQTSDTYDYCLFHYQIVVELIKTPVLGEIIEMTLMGSQSTTTFEVTVNILSDDHFYYHLLVMDNELGIVSKAKVSYLTLLGTGQVGTISVNYMSHIDSQVRAQKSSKLCLTSKSSKSYYICN